MNYRGLDLNLLRVFDVLLDERNVSRAAARIGLTQPAMSHALNRLRLAFDDPILTRVGQEMQPTRKAIELAPSIREILDRVARLSAHNAAFDPKQSHRSLVIGMTDYAASRVLPDLVSELAEQAPKMRLVVRHVARGDGPQAVEAGDIDLAIGIFLNVQQLRSHVLDEERLMCAIWAGNTQVQQRLSLDQYLKMQHVVVATRGDTGGVVERELAKLNLQRSIFCVVPHALVATAILPKTNLILTLGEGALRDQQKQRDLRILPPPIPLPKARFEMVWHTRTEADAAMQWIRRLIVSMFGKAGAR